MTAATDYGDARTIGATHAASPHAIRNLPSTTPTVSRSTALVERNSLEWNLHEIRIGVVHRPEDVHALVHDQMTTSRRAKLHPDRVAAGGNLDSADHQIDCRREMRGHVGPEPPHPVELDDVSPDVPASRGRTTVFDRDRRTADVRMTRVARRERSDAGAALVVFRPSPGE